MGALEIRCELGESAVESSGIQQRILKMAKSFTWVIGGLGVRGELVESRLVSALLAAP